MFWRKRKTSDFRDEIASHLQMETERLCEQGLGEDDARAAARRAFGNVTQAQERFYESCRWLWWDHLCQDLRFASRMLRKSPGFTSVAVLTLALGIGANTAIFSLINGLMLRTLPIKAPGQLVELLAHAPGDPEPGFNDFSWDAYRIMRDGNHVFSDLIIGSTMNFGPVQVDNLQPQTVFVGSVGGNFFQALGVQAAAGRLIGSEDVHVGYNAPVAVVSWSFWKSRFNLDPGIIGKKIVVGDDAPLTIIGVTQSGFYGLSEQAKQDIWWPMSLGPSKEFPLLARLKPGVSMEQARAQMTVLFQTAMNAPDAGPFTKGVQLRIKPARDGVSTPLTQMLSTPLTVLMTTVGLLLLLTCANLAGLLLARGASRQHEMAVRVCLGAGRGRLIRQTLTESLLLSMMGSVLGIFLAYLGTRGLIRIFASGRQIAEAPVHFESLSDPDWHILLFTVAIAITTALLFGAASAIRACRPIAGQPLQPATRTDESKSQRLFGKSLVASQVALSLALLTSAALFVGYLSHLRNLNPGFRRDHLLLLTLDFANSGYNAAQFPQLSQELVMRLDTLPGISSAAFSSLSPMEGPGAGASAFAQGHPDNQHDVRSNSVAPDYFETYGTPLLAGRYFSVQDQDKPLVAIVNQAAARDCFGNENPIGKHLTLSHINNSTKGEITYEVVGVVGNAKYNDIHEPAPPTIYPDLLQQSFVGSQLAIRTSTAPGAVAGVVRETESAVLKTVPIVHIATMDEQIDASIVPERLVAMLSGWFGALGALLATIGVYGLLAYTVTRRTHEIGVRVALGAMRSDVMRTVLRDVLWIVCAGLALGTPLAFWGKRIAVSLIPGLPVNSVVPIVFAGALMIVLALVAAFIPARRAMRVDPMGALRYE